MSKRSGTPRHPTAKLKGGWSPEEDALLASLVKQHGEGHWSPIARALNEATGKSESTGRIGKQCRERWNHHLSPGLRKGPWAPEEEVMVVDAHKKLGNRWSDIARCIPGRSENAVKNHWNATLRKRVTPDNPAGPLKEYLDSLKLTVTPRRRNGGVGGGSGGGGGGGGGGSKRKRPSRDRDDSSSDESDDDDDEEEEEAEDDEDDEGKEEEVKDGGGMGSRSGAAAAKAPVRGGGSVNKPAAAMRPRIRSNVAATVTGDDAPDMATAKAAAKAAASVKAGGGGGARASSVAALEGGTAAAPPYGRRTSKRSAAHIGIERMRDLAKAAQREEKAEAAAAAAAAGVKLEPAAVLNTGSLNAARCGPEMDRGGGEAMETEPNGGFDGGGEASELPPQLAAAAAAGGLARRPSRTESICENGLPLQMHEPPAADAAGASAAASAAAEGLAGASPFTRGAACDGIVGTGLPCNSLPPIALAAVAADGASAAAAAATAAGKPDGTGRARAACAPTPQPPQAGAPAVGGGWPPLSHNWSTNNMQMLEAQQAARRSPGGTGAGGTGAGKVWPMAAAADRVVQGPAPLPAPLPLAGRSCTYDEDFLLDTTVDFSGSIYMRHVASGSALLEYGNRPAPDLTAVTAPPSPALTAAAAAAAAAAASPPLQQPQPLLPPQQQPPAACTAAPCSWLSRLPAPNGSWTPPNLFDELHLEFGNPDSPLHDGHMPVSYTGDDEQGRGASVGADGEFVAAMRIDHAAGGAAAASAAASEVLDLAHDMEGFAAAGSGVAGNSGITSVGSPAPSGLYEYGGDSGGITAARPHVGVAAATVAADAAATACDANALGMEGSPMRPGSAVKRESGFSGCGYLTLQSMQGAASAAHFMAPFKPVAAPPPMAGAQPMSPFTPVSVAPAAPAQAPHTAPTAPATPIPWSTIPLPPHGQANGGAPVHLPYCFGAAPAPPAALPQMPALAASASLPPPLICYGMPPPLPQQQQQVQQQPHAPPPPPLQALYGGVPALYGGTPALQAHNVGAHHVQQYPHSILPPPYAVVHALPAPAQQPPALLPGASGLAGQESAQHQLAQPQQQPQQRGSVNESSRPIEASTRGEHQQQQQSEQPQQQPQPLYYVGPGYYYYSPGPYTPYGLYSTLPYHAAAAGQLPLQLSPMELPYRLQQPYPQQLQQQQQHTELQLLSAVQAHQHPQQQQQQPAQGGGQATDGLGCPASPAAVAAAAGRIPREIALPACESAGAIGSL